MAAGEHARKGLDSLNRVLMAARDALANADAGKSVDQQLLAAAAEETHAAANSAAVEFGKMKATNDPNATTATSAASASREPSRASITSWSPGPQVAWNLAFETSTRSARRSGAPSAWKLTSRRKPESCAAASRISAPGITG